MAKPWADIVQQQSGNEYAEEVVSDVGEHVRTRPAPGVTPPGGGRPSRESTDNTPVPYNRHEHDEVLGIRDNEELYAPPPPTRPADGQTPQQPQEFEAVWMDRYLKRTQAPATKSTETKKLILPNTYNPGPVADDDIEAMQKQLGIMQTQIEAAIARKAAEAERSVKCLEHEATLCITVKLPGGPPEAYVMLPGGINSVISVQAAIGIVQGLQDLLK